ncbi:MAG: ABC transporter ATP-binding protein, partial [Lachnospiraceae bacterium]|nr:ABC transporter ATP-binding protein [Lachnospiraceae bacterium]
MQKKTFGKVLKELKPCRFKVVLSFLFAILEVAGTLYLPILIGQAVDLIVGKNNVDFEGLVPVFIQMAVCIAAAALSRWLQTLLNNRIVYTVTENLRIRLFTHIQVLPLSLLDAHPSGDLVSRMVQDVDRLADGLLMGFTELFTGILTIIATLIFMFSVNPLIAAAVVVLTPFSLLLARFIANRSHRYFEAQAKARGAEAGYANEMIENEKIVQAYAYEERAAKRFGTLNEDLRGHSLKSVFFSSLVNPSTRFINEIIYTVVGVAGALFIVSTGAVSLTIGGLTVFLSYANQYAKPFNEISGVITELKNAFVSAERVYELLETPPEPDPVRVEEEGRDACMEVSSSEKTAEGHVEFRDISFGYVPEKTILGNFSLDVKPGEHIALVGKTGCGKTTLINLLLRFYETDRGDILIDGVSVREMSREELRSKFGMVLQDTWIFGGTVRENIRIGRPDATDEEVRTAAKRTHADSFIRLLPEGYDTVLKENGAGLSEGQKQLL